MHVVIAGCGRTGALTAQMLTSAGHEVTVVDNDQHAFNRLGPDFAGRTIHGNAIEQDTLRTAEVNRADVFLAAMTGDNRNIMSSQVAKTIFGVPKAIARIRDPERAQIYKELGLDVDCRTIAGAQTILDTLHLEVS